MKIQVPLLNEDGSIEFVANLSAEEAQVILQFGLNVAMTAGLVQFVKRPEDQQEADIQALDIHEMPSQAQ